MLSAGVRRDSYVLGCSDEVIDLYNQEAAPIASNVPQLCEVTQQVENQQKHGIAACLPPAAPRFSAIYYLLESGSRKIIPLKVTAKAALILTTYKTCTVRGDELRKLNAARDDYSSMKHFNPLTTQTTTQTMRKVFESQT